MSFEMYSDSDRYLHASKETVPTISHLNISVHKGELIAVVGASGAGKTLLADCILGAFEPNANVSGCIWFDGKLQTAESLVSLRGKEIAYIPQSATSLDPLMKVGKQVQGDPKVAHNRRREAKRIRKMRQEELFDRYGLAPEVTRMYPFELSGGMLRRVLLCSALIDDPKLIIADEPTPGLDLGLARSALNDLREFANTGGGVMLITHDIELALSVADRIAVFLDGTIVEETSVESFSDPEKLQHPFTRELWYALPEHQKRDR